MKKKYLKNRYLSIFLIVVMVISGITPIQIMQLKKAEAATTLSNPTIDADGVSTWDCVYFGNYWQNDTNGDGTADKNDEKEPIKWRVLSVDGDDAFLLADKILANKNFDEDDNNYWGDCTLRTWLNDDFYDTAFSENEQTAIKITSVVNNGTSHPADDDYENSDDRIFLLSSTEIFESKYGFSEDNGLTRIASYSNYSYDESYANGKKGPWWTRGFIWTAGDTNYKFYVNNTSGGEGNASIYRRYGVRPVLHLDLSNSVWTYAGTVTSNDIDDVEHDLNNYPEATTKETVGNLYQKESGLGEIELSCNETTFSKNATTYHHDLATFAAGMSTMLYNSNKNADGKENTNLTDALGALGYKKIEKVLDDPDGDKSPYYLASKTVNLNGTKTNIIFVLIRGTYNKEWIDNFESGYGKETHRGFQNACNFVYGNLCDYIKNNNLGNDNLKILISGHSRGAAVSNLLGAKLDDEGITQNDYQVNISNKDIFVYTFATPNTTSLGIRNDSKYNNIYNIVNPEDFVTKVMPSAWGYGRYGQTFVLPSSSTETVIPMDNYVRYYTEYLPNIKKYYKKYRPEDKGDYIPYDAGMRAVYTYVKSITSTVSNANLYYTKDLLTGKDTKDKNVEKSLQKLFTYTLGFKQSKTPPYDKMSKTAIENALMGYWGITGIKTIKFFGLHQILEEEFACAHRSETYLAAMNVLSEKQLRQKRSYFWATVNCPVDVTIKDSDGNIVGKIVDNVIDDTIENGITMGVEGDSKVFILPQDENFNVELIGNDEGVMDYSLSLMDADAGEMERISYLSVPVENGEIMTQAITSDSSISDVVLYDSENSSIDATNQYSKDELGQLSVDVTVEGIGTADSMKNLTAGDYVSLEAVTDENNSFLGWYDTKGNLISKDDTYSFSIQKNECFIAKFTNVVADCTGIQFEKESLQMEIGEVNANTARVLPGNATYKWITYSSSDSNVVEVGEYGLLTAVGVGTATITATSEDGKVIASSTVTVGKTGGNSSNVHGTVYTWRGEITGWGGPDSYPSSAAHAQGSGDDNFYYIDLTNIKTSRGYGCGLEFMNPYNPDFTGDDNEMSQFIKQMKAPRIKVTLKNSGTASSWNWDTELSFQSQKGIALPDRYLDNGYFVLFGNDDVITQVEIYDIAQNDSQITVSPNPSETEQPEKTTASDGNNALENTQLPSVTDAPSITDTPPVTNEPSNDTKPGRVTGLSVKNKKGRKITISWQKKADVTGYQIQYAQNKKFTKKKKSKLVSKQVSKKTISGMKKGKTYYVRVRAYNKYPDGKLYGKWSKVKKVKIKK